MMNETECGVSFYFSEENSGGLEQEKFQRRFIGKTGLCEMPTLLLLLLLLLLLFFSFEWFWNYYNRTA